MNDLTIKQKEILNVAIDLFYEKGYVETTIRVIADAMNLKPSSIYVHINSKEQIMEWLCDDIEKRFNINLESFDDESLSLKDKFLKFIENHIFQTIYNYKQYEVYYFRNFKMRRALNEGYEEKDKYHRNLAIYIMKLKEICYRYLAELPVRSDVNLEITTGLFVSTTLNMYRWFPIETLGVNISAITIHDYLLNGILEK